MKAKAFIKNNVYLKQLAVFGFLAFALLFLPMICGAAEGSESDPNLGSNLDNVVEQTSINNPISETETVVITSQASVSNEVTETAETGGNTASGNEGDGTVTTGNATVDSNIINVVNTNFVSDEDKNLIILDKEILGNLNGDYLLDPASGSYYKVTDAGLIPLGGEADCGQDTGCAKARSSNTLVNIQNNALVSNIFKISADSGNNVASGNDQSGTITTGNALVALNLLNFANSNFVTQGASIIGMVNILGDWNGNLVIPKNLLNELTSGNSGGLGLFPGSDQVVIGIHNNAELKNNIVILANTGGNVASGNGGDGQITTGDSNIKVVVWSFLNQNFIGQNLIVFLVNVMGDWNGSNLVPGLNLGLTMLGGGTPATPAEKLLIGAENKAEVKNDIEITANTGRNRANENGEDGMINTGKANVVLNIINFLNTNFIGGRIRLFLVNVLGDWNGGIVPEPQNTDGGDDNTDIPVVIVATSSGSSGSTIYRRRGVLASAVASTETTSEDDSGKKKDKEIRGTVVKTDSEKNCKWWWILSLLLALLLLGHYILADVVDDKKALRKIMYVTPLFLGLGTILLHTELSKNLTQTVYCRYLWLIVLVELGVYFLLRYRGLRIVKK